ncbi:MAG: glycosyltransferase family 39 protein [Nitrospinaceae bacterium]|nr:glycosyltransferase family 39 protein [Nitrospinaceae bacterium]
MPNDNEEALNPLLMMGPVLLAALLFSWSIFHSDLSKREAREGIPIVNMMRGGNLWLPQINPQQLRTKPPLFYWSGLISSKILGRVDEVSLRIPSVLAGMGTVFLTTFLGMRQFSPVIGCLAGLIIATCWRFAYLGSHARIDMLFTFFITLAFVALWELTCRDKKTSWLKWLAGISIGLAVLTKGPLGWLFPLLAIFIFSRVNKNFKVPWGHLLLLPFGMAGLWLVFGLIDGGKDFSTMIHQETVGRVSGIVAIQIHRKPFFYYIPQILGGMAPWSLFLPFAIWHGVKHLRHDIPWKFCAVALATLFIFLSFFSGKRGDYLLPLYPMGAVILAVFFSRFGKTNSEIKLGMSIPTWIIMGLMTFLALALTLGALLPELNFESFSIFLNSRDRWMAQLLYDKHRPAGLFLAIGAGGMLIFSLYLRKALLKFSGLKITGLIAGWAFLLYLAVHGPAARIVNEYSSFRPFAEKIKQVSENRPLFNHGKAREDLLYYLDLPLKNASQEPLGPSALLIIKKEHSSTWLNNPEFKIILEMNASFEPYQLIGKP